MRTALIVRKQYLLTHNDLFSILPSRLAMFRGDACKWLNLPHLANKSHKLSRLIKEVLKYYDINFFLITLSCRCLVSPGVAAMHCTNDAQKKYRHLFCRLCCVWFSLNEKRRWRRVGRVANLRFFRLLI